MIRDPLAKFFRRDETDLTEWDAMRQNARLSEDLARRGMRLMFDAYENDPDFIALMQQDHVKRIHAKAASLERQANQQPKRG